MLINFCVTYLYCINYDQYTANLNILLEYHLQGIPTLLISLTLSLSFLSDRRSWQVP